MTIFSLKWQQFFLIVPNTYFTQNRYLLTAGGLRASALAHCTLAQCCGRVWRTAGCIWAQEVATSLLSIISNYGHYK